MANLWFISVLVVYETFHSYFKAWKLQLNSVSAGTLMIHQCFDIIAMADKRFRRNIPILHALYKRTPRKRQQMVDILSDDTINALCDCACNIKSGNVPITTQQFKTLKPYHKQLKLLSKKSTSQKSKRKTLQSGGFLGFLLKPIAQLLLGGLK